jgi:hypothetical protein
MYCESRRADRLLVSFEASYCQRFSLTPSRKSATSGCLKVFVYCLTAVSTIWVRSQWMLLRTPSKNRLGEA